jgi:hypothetical protein
METSELLMLLRDLTVVKNPPPEGWYTTEEWARKWGVANRTARTYLNTGVKNGLMQTGMYRPEGGKQVVPHFKENEDDDSVAAKGCAKTSGK